MYGVDEIKDISKIEKVNLFDNGIEAITKKIIVVDSRTNIPFDIGNFSIFVKNSIFNNSSSITNNIKINNIVKKKNGYEKSMDSPHVFKHGKACFGSAITSLKSAINHKDYYQLFLVLIDFLDSVNIDDPAGKFIDCWEVYVDKELYDKKERKKVYKKYAGREINLRELSNIILRGFKIKIVMKDNDNYIGSIKLSKTGKLIIEHENGSRMTRKFKYFREKYFNYSYSFFVV